MSGPPPRGEDHIMSGLKYLALSIGVIAAAGASSTEQRGETPVLSVRTDLVSLTVTVVDDHGVLVPDLREQDFTVYDNGRPQTIAFFSSEEVAATIGLLIDSSGSMRGRRANVTAAAAAFAAMCHPRDEFFTVNFNETVWPGLPSDVPFTEDAGQLRVALDAAPAEGLTALYDAVARGLVHLRRGTRDRKALIVVSDGGDNASRLTHAHVVESARLGDAAVYSVTFFDPDNREARHDLLKALALDTGGQAFTVKNEDDLMRSFARIAREIRASYTIGFVPGDPAASGFRTIRVVAHAGDHRRLTARTRAGYYAGPSH
jgi:Ca-activated chloride channel family protein